MSVKERLKTYIKLQNKTISAFEKEIGVSNGYVNSISKGIGGDVLMMILEKFPMLNINWLLTGEGTMVKDTGKIGGDVIHNNKTTDNNSNKEVDIDRLRAVYEALLKGKDCIISEKNATIQELKEIIKDLREDKKQLLNIIEQGRRA